MAHSRKNSTPNTGDHIDGRSLDLSDSDRKKAAALAKSPNHSNMQWVHVPEIKQGTYIIIKQGLNPEIARENYLNKFKTKVTTNEND